MGGNRKDGNKRTLVRWSDDLDKQLLLSIQYACNEAGLRIPWDNVAKLMGEKFSDGAIVQHMSKLRQKMVDNNLPVPPPLKRGTTVVPSKIYANSGPARRKSMPETPTYTSTVLETPTPKPKPSTTRKRNRRTGLDSDSDSQPDENEMDIDDTTDDEYGASGRKRKKQQRGAKNKKPAKKQTVQESPKTEIEQTEPAKKEAAIAETDVADEDPIQQSIETPRRASRTRGVRPDYSKLEQGSDEEEEEVDTADVKKEVEADGHDEDMIAENEEDGSKTKSDGEVSPRSKAPETPATPPRLTNAAGFNNSPHSGHGAGGYPSYIETGPQYQSPQHTFAGVPSTHYHPRSNMTSFSTTRNGSASSYTSLRPAFSSQSSLNHRTLSQMPMSGHVDYLNQGGFNLHSMERGFEHDGAHDEHTFPDADDEHEGFDGLFGESHGY